MYRQPRRSRSQGQAQEAYTRQGCRHAGRPRLAVFRSARHIYVQAVNDEEGRTIAEASTRSKELIEAIAKMKKSAAAAEVGKLMAKKLLAMKIDSVVFDRGRFLYHGRVKALADGAREAGLKF